MSGLNPSPSETREAIRSERLATAKAKARQDKRENFASHVLILLFCAVLGSGLIWLIAQIWQHMPF